MSSSEEYFYSDSDDQEKTGGETKLFDENAIDDYKKITQENMYEFMIWANERREKSMSLDHFNMILQSKIYEWIEQNNITWQYALTLLTDIIKNQSNIDSHFDISSNLNEVISVEGAGVESAGLEDVVEKNIKPTTTEERRALFAAAAEKRAAKRF